MVSTFFQRTVLRHLTLVGLGYLALRVFWHYLLNHAAEMPALPTVPPPALIVPITLLGAICYRRWLRKYAPVPHNPVQQFCINLIIATYAIVIGLSIALPLHASFSNPIAVTAWPILVMVYVYYALPYLYCVDYAIAQDALGRRMTAWKREIHEAKQNGGHLRRRTSL